MTTSNLRIGLVGAGQNTRERHIPGLRAIKGVEIVSVCNRRRESTERVATDFGIPQVYDDWRMLVAATDIDAVVIGTWPNLHCPVTLAALAADKHVLCEARMASTAMEAVLMLDAARANPHLVTQVVPAPMTLAVDATVLRLLETGQVGQPLAIRVHSGARFLDRSSPLHWRFDRDLSGINIMSLGIWYECLMRWIGEAERVMASGRIFVERRTGADGQTREVTVPEHLDVIAEMACGAQANFQISTVTGLDGPDEIWIFGENGTIHFMGDRLMGGTRTDSRLSEIEIPPHEAGSWRVEEEFVGAIRGEEPVRLTTFEDGVRYMMFTAAVNKSLESGCREVVK